MSAPNLKTILLDTPRPGVMRATLNRPDRLNAMTAEMFAELGQTAAAVKADRSVRALVITGAGKGFCSGYDLEEADRVGGREPGTGDADARPRSAGGDRRPR